MFNSNGRYAMKLVSHYIRHMSKSTTCETFLRGVTAYVRKHYKKSMLQRLTEHPEDRLTCSVVVFSRLCREIWMVGDCQCLVSPITSSPSHPLTSSPSHPLTSSPSYYDNPKPFEAELAAMRAEDVRRQLADGKTVDDLCRNDTARPVIIPRMIETMRNQNITYSVVDGFNIDRRHVRVIPLDFQPWELVLASDGYPFLHPTLEESESALQHQRSTDPLNIGPRFQATKAFHPDNNSFDDRTYIRFCI